MIQSNNDFECYLFISPNVSTWQVSERISTFAMFKVIADYDDVLVLVLVLNFTNCESQNM